MIVQRSRLRSISEPPVEPPAAPTPNAPDIPASLPECSSTRKMTPTEIRTCRRLRMVWTMGGLGWRLQPVQSLEQFDRLGAQGAVQHPPVGLGELAGPEVELGVAD